MLVDERAGGYEVRQCEQSGDDLTMPMMLIAVLWHGS